MLHGTAPKKVGTVNKYPIRILRQDSICTALEIDEKNPYITRKDSSDAALRLFDSQGLLRLDTPVPPHCHMKGFLFETTRQDKTRTHTLSTT